MTRVHIFEAIRMALQSIRANLLRAVLTLLSMSIGVFAIVGVATAVGALGAKIDDQLAALGRQSFVIQKQSGVNFGRSDRKYWNRKDITVRQGMELKRRLTIAQSVGLTDQVPGAVVKYGNESTDPNVFVYGGDESFLTNGDFTLAAGRTIDQQDVLLRSDVAVIGPEISQKLFKGASPVGKNIAVNGHRYQVIGVTEPKGAVFGFSQDAFVLTPITSASKYFFDEWGSSISITVRAKSMDLLDETTGQAVGMLRAMRGVKLGEENDFEVITNESISETFSGLTQYVSYFGLGCGVIALMAAGVGIMNIMLVSVKERTREIGIRKAIGATRGNILSQFIIEAVTICELGALIGIGIGLLGGLLLGALMSVAAPVPWAWVGVSIGSCTVIGLVFGIYPAWKASRLDPIEALRYE
jgi:putative ABC transport system permease protein